MPDIDEILQAQLEAIESGQPVENVLLALPSDAQGLEPLIKLASAVRELPHPEFELAKVQQTRQRVLAASQAITRPTARRPVNGAHLRWLPAPGFATLAAICLAALILFSAAGIYLAGPPGGRSALMMDVNGRVEASLDGVEWRAVFSGDRVFSGEYLRTFGASQATLVFFGGSRAVVGANADLALSVVEAGWDQSLEVQIAQQRGTTDHSVVPLHGENSSYVVHTPGATASVQGTTFTVAVLDNGQSHFAVRTGKVHVSTDRKQVFITAGQATLAQPDQTLEYPAYTFSVSGQLTSITATTWTVEGVTFNIHENTSIKGNPVVGDDLIVTGRILANNMFIADKIEVALISQPLAVFTGEIQRQGEGVWQVSGQSVLVNADTILATGLRVGDPVVVTFSVLTDGSRLALSIASLDEAAETLFIPATPSPVPGAKPSLVFQPEEMEILSCDPEISFSGSLINQGESAADFAANVQLGWLFLRGAEYVENVDLSDVKWERIDANNAVPFTLHITPISTWAEAVGRDSTIVLQVIIRQETNRPEHQQAQMTVTLKPCEKATATPEPTEEPVTPSVPTPPPQRTPDFCNGFADHPTGYRLAARYRVPYEEIMFWFCQGYGFGEIDLAFSLVQTFTSPEYNANITIDDIFAQKTPGRGWGQIKRELQEKIKPTPRNIPPGQEKTPEPDEDRPGQGRPTRRPTKTEKP
jgi:mannose-6-phosphate isomerase-like protein (cupin superfamily)